MRPFCYGPVHRVFLCLCQKPFIPLHYTSHPLSQTPFMLHPTHPASVTQTPVVKWNDEVGRNNKGISLFISVWWPPTSSASVSVGLPAARGLHLVLCLYDWVKHSPVIIRFMVSRLYSFHGYCVSVCFLDIVLIKHGFITLTLLVSVSLCLLCSCLPPCPLH